MKKIEIQDNYCVITGVDNETKLEHESKDVTIKQENKNSQFFVVRFDNRTVTRLKIGDVQDFENTLFTAETLNAWKNKFTGNFKSTSGGNEVLETVEISLQPNATIITEIEKTSFKGAFVLKQVFGNKIENAIVLPFAGSTNEVNLTDGNTTSSGPHFNDLSTGTTNKTLPVIDFGELKNILAFRIHWFSATYWMNNFILGGSNDNDAYAVIEQYQTPPTSLTQDYILNQIASFRYIRPTCIAGNHQTYYAINEIEFFDEIITERTYFESSTDLIVKYNSDGKIVLVNTSSELLNLEIEKTV